MHKIYAESDFEPIVAIQYRGRKNKENNNENIRSFCSIMKIGTYDHKQH